METTKKAPAMEPAADIKPKGASSAPKGFKKTASTGGPIAHGTGRRKSAVARVWLRRGRGNISVNGKPANDYFDTDFNRSQILFPLSFVKNVQYDVDVNVHGGGVNAQADATKLGIARALVASDDSMRSGLKKYHLLTVDSRVKERKKYGQRGARRKFQFVKR